MDYLTENVLRVFAIGIVATAVMDLWLLFLKQLKVRTLDFALVGRWIGHWFHGKWFHDAVSKAAPIKGELLIGWLTHYAIGIGFAALLVAVGGAGWIRNPTFAPAFLTGVATVIAHLFIMQPAMGAGIASSRTPTPLHNCLRSVVNHSIFGLGLYLAGSVFAHLA